MHVVEQDYLAMRVVKQAQVMTVTSPAHAITQELLFHLIGNKIGRGGGGGGQGEIREGHVPLFKQSRSTLYTQYVQS